MNHMSSPLKVASYSFVGCVLIGVAIVSIDHEVLTNPLRLAILIGVAVLVPIGNYFLLRRRFAHRKG